MEYVFPKSTEDKLRRICRKHGLSKEREEETLLIVDTVWRDAKQELDIGGYS